MMKQEWLAPVLEELDVKETSVFGISPSDDGTGDFTGS